MVDMGFFIFISDNPVVGVQSYSYVLNGISAPSGPIKISAFGQTVWNLKLNTSYLGDAREWQREHLRITSCLVCILWDCVARTRTSITRRPIRVVTQRVATFMTLTTLVI